MSVYLKGKMFYMKFTVRGQFVRQSTGSRTKQVAERIERETRRSMELSAAGIPEPARVPLFDTAADEWMDFKRGDIEDSTLAIHRACIRHLKPVFGSQLLSSITREGVRQYQRDRVKSGAARKTVNLEIGTLRGILIHFSQWERIKRDVKMLRLTEEDEVGRELSSVELAALLEACQMSSSRLLYCMVVLALETGARYGTIKNLRWRSVQFEERSLRWGKDKTPAGSGRVVPLNQRAIGVLQFMSDLHPNHKPEHFVFPSETIGGSGEKAARHTDPTKPTGTVKTAWKTVKLNAGWILAGKPKSKKHVRPLVCRFHDLRHTATSRMLKANRGDTHTVGRIMGWSASTMVMMAMRYSHYRVEDLRATVDGPEPIQENGAQNGALSVTESAVTSSNASLSKPSVTQ